VARRKTKPEDEARGRYLGAVLEDCREKRQLTIRRLAVLARVEYETVRTTLAGRAASPGFFLVVHLAKALDLPLDELNELVDQKAQRHGRTTKG
jgi:transcriptional regulator with XRE-family HTH domain